MMAEQTELDKRVHAWALHPSALLYQRCKTPPPIVRHAITAEYIAELETANAAQDREIERMKREKDARVYYQGIVYAVCNEIDQISGTRLVCGTPAEPSTEVQEAMARIREAAEAAREHREPRDGGLPAAGGIAQEPSDE